MKMERSFIASLREQDRLALPLPRPAPPRGGGRGRRSVVPCDETAALTPNLCSFIGIDLGRQQGACRSAKPVRRPGRESHPFGGLRNRQAGEKSPLDQLSGRRIG